MKILIVRLSSLGDILHMFPAVTDLRNCFPNAEIHWLVEPAFAEMVAWHSAVDKVLTVPLRAHKKTWWKIPRLLSDLRGQLWAEKYDRVLDAQGLLKSAFLAWMSGVPVSGFHADCVREPLAARFYRRRARVPEGLHVIEKNRQLVALIYGADISEEQDFGLEKFRVRHMRAGLPEALVQLGEERYIVLLHGTTWNSKYWPESAWAELIGQLTQAGWRCLLPWGNGEERLRAQRLQEAGGELAQVLPKLTLTELVDVLLHARAFVSVETGIGHLAAVLDIPGIMLHGPTDPEYSGILGKSCRHISSGMDCSPCFKRNCPKLLAPGDIPPCQLAISAQRVFQQCQELLATKQEEESA
ncbi:MAG TPA: lipopolysaccharide heptosyltransferase I [Gallionella sp.]|nr:lipopolysaccharide heptosyltransferase I [Gallionella sp.]